MRKAPKQLTPADVITRVPGIAWFSPTGNGAANSAYLSPNNSTLFGSRLPALAKLFELFRFTKFKVKLLPVQQLQAIAYTTINYVVSNPPSLIEMAQQSNFLIQSPAMNLPSWMDCSTALRDRLQPWFPCNGGSPDADVDYQGALIYYGPNAQSFYMQVEYVIEFSKPTNAANETIRSSQPSIRSLAFPSRPIVRAPSETHHEQRCAAASSSSSSSDDWEVKTEPEEEPHLANLFQRFLANLPASQLPK
jgi:hypothetical protein